jgi:hypothetical protein
MMICALYGHRLALDGRPEYKILPLAAATAIMSCSTRCAMVSARRHDARARA